MHDSFNGNNSSKKPNMNVVNSLLNPMGHTSVIQQAAQSAASNKGSSSSSKNYSTSYRP